MFYMKKWLLFAKVSYQDDTKSEAKFIVSDWGEKVDSGIWLSNRPARLQAYNTMPESTISPSQGYCISLSHP
jgi:hypothetical protein